MSQNVKDILRRLEEAIHDHELRDKKYEALTYQVLGYMIKSLETVSKELEAIKKRLNAITVEVERLSEEIEDVYPP